MTAAYTSSVKHELTIDERSPYWSRSDDVMKMRGDVKASADNCDSGLLLDQPVCLTTSSNDPRYTESSNDVLDLSRQGHVKVIDEGNDDGVLNLSSSSGRGGDLAVDSSSDDVTVDYGNDVTDTSSTLSPQVSSAGSKRSPKGAVIKSYDQIKLVAFYVSVIFLLVLTESYSNNISSLLSVSKS